ncbi:MAG TPA: hypothetical protein VK348_06960, partial [Planctomycetota bacterium]|nr:hypothetical protein [Planctomycetota bacterium]
APAAAAAPAPVAQDKLLTEDGVIAGTMDIDFATRTNLDTTGNLKKGSPALGAKDTYKLEMTVAKTTQFSGSVFRLPNLYSSTLGRKKQDAQINYSIDLAVMLPSDVKQKKVVGKWVGTVPIDTESGAYDLAGGKEKESALRVAIDAVGKARAFNESFAGKLMGKAEKKESLASYTFKRVVGDRTVQVVVKKSDPMRFENLALAMGPAESYPRTMVSGRLDYDYETGNYYTDGITLKYALDGKEYEDVITGSIKWIEDKDRASNGKGYYDFNLRFNEAKNKKATGEGAAFEKMSEEDAFFAVDNSIPSLTGRISYVDTMGSDGKSPISSKVSYALNANKLTKQQVMAFFKLWLIAVGPTNDE